MKKGLLLALLLTPLLLGAVERPAQRTTTSMLDGVRDQVIAHAPYKQWDLVTGHPNRAIGRTPGAACEAISYLVEDSRVTGDAAARRKAIELADWVIDLQRASSALAVSGGVPATPDLGGVQGTYYYVIDAGFCASAMLDVGQLARDARYDASANAFGGFVLSMMRDASGRHLAAGSPGRGPCEAVVQPAGGKPAWNCRRYVKSLALLPVLSRLEALHPGMGYAAAASDIRSSMLPGLKGMWEYAEGPAGDVHWHRIEGPHGEPDTFVFGDTISYALKGLYEYEGASTDVRAVYADAGHPRMHDARTAGYDPRGAYAGYIVASTRSADPFSHYYDIVTMGHMRLVRAGVSPADLAIADDLLVRHVAQSARIGWKMDMMHRVSQTGMGDISTLSSIGTALVAMQKAR